ncbi:MAG: RIO1 family regulatory kinase/ATPase [Promethearchaeia archaeon]
MEAAKIIPDLEKEDFRILMAIELGMKRSEYVSVGNIRFYSRYPMEETQYRLDKVHKLELIYRTSSQYERAYTLNSTGYDVLALHALVEKGIITQLGPALGKGKESDVYSCMDDDDNIYALKIYRMGRTSFKKIRNLRDLIGDRQHTSWLYVNRLAARREFEILKKLEQLNVKTPKPIGYNRHIFVMEYLRGKELTYYKDIDDPEFLFEIIIQEMKEIYQELDLIHGDFGEFNVIVEPEGDILIIDWLQAVSTNHPNADGLLKRDLNNICSYFEQKYGVKCSTAELVREFKQGD